MFVAFSLLFFSEKEIKTFPPFRTRNRHLRRHRWRKNILFFIFMAPIVHIWPIVSHFISQSSCLLIFIWLFQLTFMKPRLIQCLHSVIHSWFWFFFLSVSFFSLRFKRCDKMWIFFEWPVFFSSDFRLPSCETFFSLTSSRRSEGSQMKKTHLGLTWWSMGRAQKQNNPGFESLWENLHLKP